MKDSFSDGMPLCSEKGDVSLVFSGEEYSDPDVVRGLKQREHPLGERRASYLVHTCEENPNFPACLNGILHGFLTNRTRRRVRLFNDSSGMHRLYYHESKEAFHFAGEAKAILAARPELR